MSIDLLKTAEDMMSVNPDSGDLSQHEDKQITQKIRDALSQYMPVTSSDNATKLELLDVRVDRSGDVAQKPKAINDLRYKGKSYSVPVKAKMRLTHKGDVLDEKELTIANHHPIVPGLNTRLIDGNLYQSKFQVRRQPGVYPYRSEKGQDRVEFNTSKGRAFQFVVDGDKEDHSTMDFFVTKTRQTIPRGGYAMLRALGKDDEEIKKQWGEDIWQQNAYKLDADGNPTEKLDEKDLTKAVDRVYNALKDKKQEKVKSSSMEEASKNLKKRLDDMDESFDPTVNERTIGVSSNSIDPSVIDKSLESLVKQHTGERKPPHRFSERFRTLHGMPDQIGMGLSHYSLQNNMKSDFQRMVNEVAENDGKISKGGTLKKPTIGDVASRGFSKARKKVNSVFKNSDLSTTTETNNILDLESRSKEITIKGPGGIQSKHAVTPETISLHPSRLGLMDVVKTQVSAPGETMPMASGAIIDPDGQIKRMAYDRKLGKMRPVSTEEVDDDGIAFPDEFDREEVDGELTFTPKNKKVKAAIGDEVMEVDEKDVRYVLSDETHMFSDNTNIIPFLNHDSGPRAIMGANQMTQALSLKDRESPLVDTIDEKGETFSHRIGDKYNAHAPVSGKVVAVDEDEIDIEDANGNVRQVPLLKDFPLNQGGFIDQEAKVKVGDEVSKGDTISSNNYTDDDGELAIGRNLRTAYLPFDGWNYEDAIVMSETGASKLTSEGMEEVSIELQDEDMRSPRDYNAHQGVRGNRLTLENERKLGDDGVIKEGAEVEPGDILAVCIRPVDVKDEEEQKVRRVIGGSFKSLDKSLKWDGSSSGVVKKVEKSPSKVSVFVRTEEPFKEGDKLCYTPDHEVLTDRGWIPFPDLKMTDEVCTLDPDTNEIKYDHPTQVTEFDHDGDVYRLETNQLDFKVTPGHQMFVNPRNPKVDGEEFAGHHLMKARDIFGKRVKYKTDGSWSGVSRETLTIPALSEEPGWGGNNKFLQEAYSDKEVPASSLLYLIGIYIAEGSTTDGGGGNYSINIAQKRARPGYALTVKAFAEMGFTSHKKDDRIVVHNKQLWNYIRNEVPGHVSDKRIPRWILSLSKENLQSLFKGLVDGNGHQDGTKYVYTTTSKGLADDVHELALKLGMAGRLTHEEAKTETIKGAEYECSEKWRVDIRTKRLEPTVNHGHYKEQDGQVEKWEEYNGKVYCCTVPTHVLYVRRNGKAAWCGNTGRHGEKGIVSKILPDDEMPQDKDGKPMDMLLDPHGVPCYDPETEILTYRGWVRMDEVEDSDAVATLNPDTFDFEWQEMEEYHRHDYEGKMYEIQNQQIDLKVTPNHNMWVQSRGARKLRGSFQMDDPEHRDSFSLEKAKTIQGKARRYLKTANWKESNLTQFIHVPAGSYGGTCPSAQSYNFYDHNWAEFIGWFVTEGSAYSPRKGTYRVGIWQSEEANPEHYDRIKELLNNMRISFQERKGKGFVISHKGLYERLKPLGGSSEKYIPREVLEMGRENLQRCFDAMIAGDGCVYNNEKTGHKKTVSFTTTSHRLAGDMQELAIKLGMSANIREDKREEKYADGVTCYCMSIAKKNYAPWTNWGEKAKKSQHEAMVDYSGKVYCPTVPNGIVMVRRDGKHVWSGNSRANPGQIMELAAGKIAKETGEKYKVKNFTPNMLEKVKKDLDDLGLSDKEDLYDPKTGRKIPNVATGYAYKAKLKHKIDKKFKARKFFDPEHGYDLDEQPVSGAAIDNLTLHALIGHNARANMSEMARLKGTNNTDYWQKLANGIDPPRVADSPFSFKKMKGMMESLGVNIEKDDQDELKIIPATDEAILKKSSGEMTEPGGYTVRANSIDAIESSVFDPNLVGRNKKNWNHIDIGEKVPNPLFDKAIALLLKRGSGTKEDAEEVRVVKDGDASNSETMKSGFNFSDVRNVYAGDVELMIGNEVLSGPDALEKALDTVDVGKTIDLTEKELKDEFKKVENGDKKTNPSKINNMHLSLRYAQSLKENEIDPKDGYMMSKVPVMPTEFRQPFVNQSTGEVMMPSVNNLYRSVIAESQNLKKLKEIGFDDEMLQESRKRMVGSFGALLGNSGDRPQGNFEGRGIVDTLSSPKTVSGTQQFDAQDGDAQGPKKSYPQDKVVKKKMEASGRTTIIPDPDLSVDEVGLPEEMAWRMYEPFVRKRMVKKTNLSPADARVEYKDRTDRARSYLEEELDERPVMTNRAPSWWSYNIMSFKPKLIKSDPENEVTEKALRVPNLVVNTYFGGDYDGDSVSLDTHIVLRVKGRLWQGTFREFIKEMNGYVPDENAIFGVEGLETQNADGEWVPVSEVSVHRVDKPTYEVETYGGHKVRVTSDHSLMVGGEEVRPENLEKGDTLDNVENNGPAPSSPTSSILGEKPTREMGFLIGHMFGDGGYDDVNGRFYFSVLDDDVMDRIETSVDTTELGHLSIGKKYANHYGEGRTATINRSDLRGEWEALAGKLADQKFVSGTILGLPEKALIGVTEGYIAADGSVESTSSGSYLIRTWSNSKALRDGMSSVLWRLNVRHSKRKRTTKGKPSYLLSIGRDGIERLHDLGIDLPGEKGEKFASAIYDYNHNRERAKRTMPSLYRVKEVREVEQEPIMIDLSVPDDHVFTVDSGIVVHNTMSVHVPAEDEAVQEAKKMKPSNHLKAPGSYNLMINPNQSMLLGMNLMSKGQDIKNQKIKKKTDSPLHDYENGDINLDDAVEYKGKKETAGWAIVDQAIQKGSDNSLNLDKLIEEINKERSKENKDLIDRSTFEIDKWSMREDVLPTLIENHKENYAPIMSELSRAGNIASKFEGFTVGLSDMKTLKDKAQALSSQADQLIPEVSKEIAKEKGLDGPNKQTDEAARIRLYSSARDFDVKGQKVRSVSSRILDSIKSGDDDDNAFYKMMNVGSKGNERQIQQVLGSYGVVDDVQGNTVPNPIKNSLSDGLTTSEYFTQQHGAIAGLRDRSVETSKPGDIGKQIVAGSSRVVVSMKDCGTKKGEDLPVLEEKNNNKRQNRNIVDRVLAEDVPEAGLKKGELITGHKFSKIESTDLETVKVRSPLHCEADEGVCQKCFGYNERGKYPDIGENVGIREGQSIVEASTKLTLKSFHTGGATEDQQGGFDEFEEVVHLKNPVHKATIVKLDGPMSRKAKVTNIEERKGPSGRVSSRVIELKDQETGDTKSIRAPARRKVKVQVGDVVSNGEALTSGRRDPNELILLGKENEGVQEVQKDVTENLYNIFDEIGGINRRAAETVVSAMSSYGQVTDPGDSDYTTGDRVKINKAKNFNKDLKKKVPIYEAKDHKLLEDVQLSSKTISKGTYLSENDVENIRLEKGPNFRVMIEKDPININQEMNSVLNLPRVGGDWLPKLNYRKIKKEITDAGIRGDSSDVHGSHPIGAYMYGKDMDDGTRKDKWNY